MKFDNEEDELKTNWTVETENFDEMGLKETVLRGVYGHGFMKPTPIQQKAILPILQGKDTIAQAQSGTGKTGCFAISTLQLIDTSSFHTQAIIVAPARELAMQISSVVQQVGEYTQAKVHCCVGGTSIREELKILN